MKLTDEQLEEVLQGRRPAPGDLDESQRRQLAEAAAVRDRLRAAFETVSAPEALADRIRSQLADGPEGQSGDRPHKPNIIRIVGRLVPLAAAAAVLIAVVPMLLNMGGPKPAAAAQAQLASIHEANLKEKDHLHHKGDRDKLAVFLARKLGTPAALPQGDDVDFCGCGTTRFRSKTVATYMLNLSGRRVSIVITNVDPGTLGFQHKFARAGRTFWACGFGDCRMVAMRLGQHTYFAVGETSHDDLIDVLVRLLPEGAASRPACRCNKCPKCLRRAVNSRTTQPDRPRRE